MKRDNSGALGTLCPQVPSGRRKCEDLNSALKETNDRARVTTIAATGCCRHDWGVNRETIGVSTARLFIGWT